MSGFIQSSVFPVFESAKEPFKNFREFAALSMPATHADVAKALVWSFIAGFSERLVPSFITKIAQDADTKNHSDPEDGQVLVWGEVYDGPIDPPPGLDQVRAIAAGSSHTVAVISALAWCVPSRSLR